MPVETPEILADEAQPFGTYAPSPFLARLMKSTRRLGTGFPMKQVAFALRRLALLALKERPVDTETLGARFRLYPQGNICEKRILFTPQMFDPLEREILASRIGPGFRFVDVGANVGAYSLFVAARAKVDGRILAIEPQPHIFERLATNIRFNPFGNVKAVACALADKAGELTLFIDRRNSGESSVKLVGTHATESVKVPALTLLALLRAEGYDRVDALKLDVEGAEDIILQPFLEQAPATMLPNLIILENGVGRWNVDLPSLIEQSGYREIARTRLNLVYERVTGSARPAREGATT